MGFLRKVGRKIKKKVNKLFGGKFGKILGGVGLSMMFFGGAQALFGKSPWWEGFSERLKNTKLFTSQSLETNFRNLIQDEKITPGQ